jgi:hypothetical protein
MLENGTELSSYTPPIFFLRMAARPERNMFPLFASSGGKPEITSVQAPALEEGCPVVVRARAPGPLAGVHQDRTRDAALDPA